MKENLMKILSVFLSASTCIYENLAFEEWIFRNHKLARSDALIIWRNRPAVVIGRFQNPWIEANVHFCRENGVALARRYSGGGAVFHDLGNLNVSVLTSQERHCRKRSLQALASQLNADLPLTSSHNIAVNERHDLVMQPQGSKISGTAARISHGRAYHHFTLLVDSNLDHLRRSLHSPLRDQLETNATRSVRSDKICCIIQKLSAEYSEKHGLVDIVIESVVSAFSSQYKEKEAVIWSQDDDQFSGVRAITEMLRSKEWIYGKTPKFVWNVPDDGGIRGPPSTINVENGRISESGNPEFPEGDSFYHAFLNSNYGKIV